MKESIKRIPIVGPLLRKVYRTVKPMEPFLNSASYWDSRYKAGGNSGSGSYGKLAEFKAKIINDFVEEHKVQSVIEHGCGDGHQISLANYKSYLGLDVSSAAISLCRESFGDDTAKSFKTNEEYQNEKAELALSLDVIFHLVENDVYYSYMKQLFDSSEKFVIIYSSNKDEQLGEHERHREFTSYIDDHFPDWKLMQHIPNDFPYNGNENKGSKSDFYIYRKSS